MRKQVRALAWSRCWVNSVPPNPRLPEPVSVTLLGNRVFAHVIGYDEDILVPFSEGTFGHRHTQRRGHVTQRQGLEGCCPKPRNVKECQQPTGAGRAKSIFPSSLQRESGPHLTLHFWPPELGEKKALLFDASQLVALCYSIFET